MAYSSGLRELGWASKRMPSSHKTKDCGKTIMSGHSEVNDDVNVAEKSHGNHETEIGERMSIASVGMHDTPELGGNLLEYAIFPGQGKVELYPECMPLSFPPGSIEISLDSGVRTRPTTACISLDGDQVIYHPPADQPHLRAMARLCERYGIKFSAPDASARLAVELARQHEPGAFRPAGRELTRDERRMSIAWLVDQERWDDETILWTKLVEYQLIEPQCSIATVLRLVKQGNRLLAERQMERWKNRPPGRPRMGTRRPR